MISYYDLKETIQQYINERGDNGVSDILMATHLVYEAVLVKRKKGEYTSEQQQDAT